MLFQDFNYGIQSSWFNIVLFLYTPKDKRITNYREVLPVRFDIMDISCGIFFSNKEVVECIYHRHENHNIRRAKLIQDTKNADELIQYIQEAKDSRLTTDLLTHSMFTGKSFNMTKEDVII